MKQERAWRIEQTTAEPHERTVLRCSELDCDPIKLYQEVRRLRASICDITRCRAVLRPTPTPHLPPCQTIAELALCFLRLSSELWNLFLQSLEERSSCNLFLQKARGRKTAEV